MEVFLSVDPGLEDIGWAVIESDGKEIVLKGFGLIKTDRNQCLTKRLKTIYDEISDKIRRFSVTQGAIEEMYFVGKIKNQVLSLYAKGVILLAFENHKINCQNYNPSSVKKMIVGNGKATKEYIEKFIRMMFGIKEKLYPDISDAISIGIAASRLFFLKKKTHYDIIS